MRRSLLIACVVLLAWIAGRMSAPVAEPTQTVIPPPEVHVHVPPPPEPEALPAPPPPSWPDGRRDRFALRDAPGVLSTWSGVVAAPGAPALAVWDGKAVLWSGDDGHTWTRHALPEGASVRFAAADEGRVHILLSGGHGALWTFAPGGARTSRSAPLPAAKIDVFTAGAGRIAVLGQRPVKRPPAAAPSPDAGSDGAEADAAEEAGGDGAPGDAALLVSEDQGASWQERPAPWVGNAGNALRLEAGGEIVHMQGHEAPCGGGGQQRSRLAPGASEWAQLAWPLDTPLAFWIGPGGWAYGAGDCRVEDAPASSGRIRLCAIGSRGDRAAAGPEIDARAEVEIASNGRATYAVAGGALFRVKGGSFRRVAADVPASIEPGARVDSAGRLVAIAGGRVVRWSSAGWEVLLPG